MDDLFSTLKPGLNSFINNWNSNFSSADPKEEAGVNQVALRLKDRLLEVADSIRDDIEEAQTTPRLPLVKWRRYYIDIDSLMSAQELSDLASLRNAVEDRVSRFSAQSRKMKVLQTARSSVDIAAAKSDLGSTVDLLDLDHQIVAACKAKLPARLTATSSNVIDRTA